MIFWPNYAFPSALLLRRVKVETPTVKVDGHLEIRFVPETIGVFFTVPIFVFSPSLAALVIRCSK
jgi:hypothetical protein